MIQTLKGQENKVAAEVIRDVVDYGEDVFVYKYEKEYKIKGEWIKDQKPFFPGYIFVDMEESGAELFDRRLRKSRHKLMDVDGIITAIRPEEQDYLMRLGGEEHIIRHSEGFRIDDYIVITSGPFKGYNGEIRKLDRHHRKAAISIPLLGRDTEVEIDLEIVESRTFQELGSKEKIDRLNMAKVVTD
ncbi:MAG: hypothetical protein K6E91_09640 [Butyrivibrio sp.]|nr:hypothetical protein [Butyrivibrio sp.]